LYIVNKLVEAHGGRIEARSTRGEGSTFIVHLPQPEPVERELGEDLLRA
jgi:two-component system sensor histidine kinase BaeS